MKASSTSGRKLRRGHLRTLRSPSQPGDTLRPGGDLGGNQAPTFKELECLEGVDKLEEMGRFPDQRNRVVFFYSTSFWHLGPRFPRGSLLFAIGRSAEPFSFAFCLWAWPATPGGLGYPLVQVGTDPISPYLPLIRGMLRPRALPVGFIPPCLPIKAPEPPTGAAWIKRDGFRVIGRKDGATGAPLQPSRQRPDSASSRSLLRPGQIALTLLHHRRRGCCL